MPHKANTSKIYRSIPLPIYLLSNNMLFMQKRYLKNPPYLASFICGWKFLFIWLLTYTTYIFDEPSADGWSIEIFWLSFPWLSSKFPDPTPTLDAYGIILLCLWCNLGSPVHLTTRNKAWVSNEIEQQDVAIRKKKKDQI